MNQNEWITRLFSDLRPEGFDPYVEVHNGDSYGGWEKWSNQDHVDERNPLPNEIVFDPDLRSQKKCHEVTKEIASFLDDNDIPYFVADTGGTGYHIHVFFDANGLPLEHYRGARIALFELIKDDLVEYGIDEDIVRDSKKLDHGVVTFNENESKGHLIRAVGGRKLSSGDHKTVVDDFEKEGASRDDVTYPSDVEPMTVSSSGYVDAPYTMDEIEEKAREIKKKEEQEKKKKQRQAYESDEDGLDGIRSIPAHKVLQALGVDASTDQMVMCKGHDDTDASLYINDDGRAICWGSCGEPGKVEYKNAIDLVEDRGEMDFREIVEFLCEEFDMENPLDKESDESGKEVTGQGDVNLHSEKFLIELFDLRNTGEKMKARVETTHKETGDTHFAQATISARSLKQYAKTAAEVMTITDEEQKEIWKTILKNKTDIREEILDKDEQSENDIDEILKAAYKYAGTPSVDEMSQRFDGFEYTARQNQDFILINDSNRVILTEDGEERAEELLGISADGIDVDKKAQEMLEDDPLGYYLEAFDDLHKGDHLLKIWELLSALSSMGDEPRQIHSWAVGPSGKGKSVTGDTDVVVKKDDGWHIQSIASLHDEYDGQDWKTMGIHPTRLDVVETPIEDVFAHRNKRSLMTIKTRSGREITGTKDHSFLKHKDGEVVPATGEELREGDYLPVTRNVSFGSISGEPLLNESVGYILGMYLAEGYRHTNNRIHITNENAQAEIERRLDESRLEWDNINGDRYSIDISPYSNIFDKAKTGSGEKVVPPQVYVSSKEVVRSVLQGYFDGDGIDGEQVGYTTASERLGKGLSFLLNEFGIITTHRKRWNGEYNRHYYRFRICKPESLKRFYDDIGWRRDEPSSSWRERNKQQNIDRVPVDSDKVAASLRKNRFDDGVGRNNILNAIDEELGRSKLEEGLDMYDYGIELPYVRSLRQNIESDIFWDRIEEIENHGSGRHRVYDIAAGDVPHFLTAEGILVHNSHIKRQLTTFLPDDSYLMPSSISPKALLYLTEQEGTDYFKNKLIFFDEAQSENEEKKITLLREMTDQDNDVLTHLTVKDQEPKTLVLELPVTVWFTSVESINDEQLKNRFILTNPDSSEEVDEEVFQHQQERLHKGQDLAPPPDETPVLRRMIQLIRSEASDLDPVLPFKTEWKQKFNRRLYPFFVSVVGLIAKIHYRNREIKNGQILCTKDDFELASKIWGQLITTTIAQQDEEALKLAMNLPEHRQDAVTTSDIQSELPGFTTKKAYRKAMNLMETEELQLINGEKEKGSWHFWAGADRDLFSDPEPELVFDEETFAHFLEPTAFDADDAIVDYFESTDIKVIDRLENDEFGGVEHYAATTFEDGSSVEGDSDHNTQPNDGGNMKNLRTRVREYLEEREEATYEELNDHFTGKKESEVEDVVDEMLNEGELYEHQPGRVRLL